jgi:hypothetical protein
MLGDFIHHAMRSQGIGVARPCRASARGGWTANRWGEERGHGPRGKVSIAFPERLLAQLRPGEGRRELPTQDEAGDS